MFPALRHCEGMDFVCRLLFGFELEYFHVNFVCIKDWLLLLSRTSVNLNLGDGELLSFKN